MSAVHFVVPGALARPTGGSRYDRQIIEGLRQRGLAVTLSELPGVFPPADETGAGAIEAALAGLAERTPVVADGLVLGGLPTAFARHARRLRLHALVHHPLADETGLDAATAERLLATEKRALASVERVIATSQFTARRLRQLGLHSGPVEVIEPACTPAPLARGSGERTPTLLCVASLTPRKAQHVLLEALAVIRDRAWRCRLIGPADLDADYAARLDQQRRALRLQDRVAITGALDAAALAAAYRAADVFVLPSVYEGYGMVVSEAIAHGLPVVTTTGGALAETLPAEAGLAVPPHDAAALADALGRLLDEPGLRQSLARGAARARQRLAGWAPAIERFAMLLGDDGHG